MNNEHAILGVSHSQYYLAELGAIAQITPAMYTGFNGLISAHGSLAIIMTGTEFGNVSIEADWRDQEPSLDLDSWDDVVEVSLLFRKLPATLFGPNDDDARNIPPLDPGSYRVRVHARGRDRGDALRTVEGAPVEEHLLVAWPTPAAPEMCHKLTDSYGAGIRAR